MAVKPREQWSEAYRKRVERAEARGKTKQQARGHKAAEHRTRKSREPLTTVQRERIKRFARSQFKRTRNDDYDEMKRFAEAHGYEKFVTLMERQRLLERRYKHAKKPMNENLEDMIGFWETADEHWLYYH